MTFDTGSRIDVGTDAIPPYLAAVLTRLAAATLVGSLFRRHELGMDVISSIWLSLCDDKSKEDCPSVVLISEKLQNERGARAV